MDEYEETINQAENFSMPRLIEICRNKVPPQYARRPYLHPELRNGTALLHSEDGMNCYIAAYGEMHMAKCRRALQNFPFDSIDASIEIVDWGCGQGIGSLCLIDALKVHYLSGLLKRVTLIEPSQNTLRRAVINVRKDTGGNVTIVPVNEYMPTTMRKEGYEYVSGMSYRYHYVIHIFSNILDIRNLDLCEISRMVASSGHQHFVLCMGPVNGNCYKIDQFCSIFGEQKLFSQISSRNYGRTTDTFYTYTCKTKCFLYDGRSLDFSRISDYTPSQPVAESVNEYDPQMAVDNGSISQAQCDLYKMFDSIINDNDILVLKPDINGDKPDLIVVRPHIGVLIVTVFEDDLNDYRFVTYEPRRKGEDGIDYTRLTRIVSSDDTDSINSPLETVGIYWDDLVRLHIDGLMEQAVQNNRNWGIVKKMVFFARNTTQEATSFFTQKDKYTNIIGKDILEDAATQRVLFHNIFFDRYNNVFDEVMMRGLMRIISPGWHSYKEGRNIKLTPPQRILARSESGRRQKISGVAGSGKTQVLATRAVNAQLRTGGDILILTYNIALANYMRYRMGEVRADFPWSKLNITYYHRFFRSMAARIGLHVSFGSYEDETFFLPYRNKLPKYDAIFIDEVQDYDSVWLQILNDNFLKEGGEFVVFGDPKQNVYRRPLDNQGDIRLGFIGGAWNHTLRDGMRFSNPQLARLAYDFQRKFLNRQHSEEIKVHEATQSDLTTCIKYANIGDNGDTERLARYCKSIFKKFHIKSSETVVLAQMGDILRLVDHEYRAMTNEDTTTTFMKKEGYDQLLEKHNIPPSMDALANYRFRRDKDAIEHGLKERFTMDTRLLKLSTIQSYKGWESPSVILFLESEFSSTPEFRVTPSLDTPEIIYTAIIRARENLYIINLGNLIYDEFFRTHIHN